MEIRTILCPVDFTPISERNVRMGVEMCTRIGARLMLHHNLDVRPPGYLAVAWMWSEDHEAEHESRAAAVPEQLEELFARIPEPVAHEARMTRGPLDAAVLWLAREIPADLIVMGTHGRSSAEHESLTERIIIQAPCSVLTIGEGYVPEEVFDAEPRRPPEDSPFLIPVDFTPRARAVLDFAFALGESMPHGLHLLHVVKETGGSEVQRQAVEEAGERLRELVPPGLADRTTVHVLVGDPVERILGKAEELDALCIVMAAHGKSLLKRFLFGTTTMSILHGARCPVWFVPPVMQTARSDSSGAEEPTG